MSYTGEKRLVASRQLQLRRASGPTATPSGVCHGTLGELFQGPLLDGDHLEIALVSMPIDKFSWVYFFKGEESPVPAFEGRSKCLDAVRLFCTHHKVNVPEGRWEFFSEIPVGQGMASSTADIVATIRCLYSIFAIPYDESTVRSILSEIERADSVFLNEFALYLSRKHEVVQSSSRSEWTSTFTRATRSSPAS